MAKARGLNRDKKMSIDLMAKHDPMKRANEHPKATFPTRKLEMIRTEVAAGCPDMCSMCKRNPGIHTCGRLGQF